MLEVPQRSSPKPRIRKRKVEQMVLIERPGFGRDVVFAAKIAAATFIALCFGIVWYGLIGWAVVWGVLKIVGLLF